MHYFEQFKDHNLGRKKGNQTNDPIFSSTFSGPTVCDIHFVFEKSQNWSILRWKLWDQNFVPFDSGNTHLKESKKPSFTFSVELQTKFVWSHGLFIIVLQANCFHYLEKVNLFNSFKTEFPITQKPVHWFAL